MLLAKGKITQNLVRMMEGWRHSGLNVFCGERIYPREKRSLENLTAYLIRPLRGPLIESLKGETLLG
jgi:hypothetical protein